MSIPHNGTIIAGKFYRGDRPGRGSHGGDFVNSFARDRVRALQLMVKAMPKAQSDDQRNEVSTFFESFADMILGGRGYNDAWRLQILSELVVLPDYEPGWGGWYGENRGAPVDEQGNPVFYYVPKSFDTAKNDGERWRWCLAEAVKFNAAKLNQIRIMFADFLRTQFGVQTMAWGGWNIGRMADDDAKENESGTYALHTLAEDETIARLATGVKRFKLPDEFNFIKIYQQVAADRETFMWQGVSALQNLTQIFENRRQYPRAAEYCRKLVAELRELKRNDEARNWQQHLDQIVGNWGRFEPVMSQAAGRGASVEFRFRNGKNVSFTAEEIKIEKLLDDVKAYIKSRPKQLEHEKIDIGNLGYRLVTRNETKVCRRTSSLLANGTRTPSQPLRPPSNRGHAAYKGGRVSAYRQNGRRQHQQNRHLDQRHGYCGKTTCPKKSLLPGRFARRQTYRGCKPRILRLPHAAPTQQPFRY